YNHLHMWRTLADSSTRAIAMRCRSAARSAARCARAVAPTSAGYRTVNASYDDFDKRISLAGTS
ncbi:MAG TPA: hypothetical protein VFS96_04550, partial [Nitrolancea sp.]|nr:hypothetical protein [Nitrolancea sp.]